MTNKKIKQITDTVNKYGKAKIAIVDIDGVLRGKVISSSKFNSILKSGLGFCNVVFGWDSADVCYDNAEYTGWHSGYPDANVSLDLSTFRQIPWDGDMPFFLGSLQTAEGADHPICPRGLLRKVIQSSEEAGFLPMFSQEFEWFNFKETPKDLYDKQFINLQPITPGMFGYSLLRTSLVRPFFNDLFDLLTAFDIPIEGIHTETGPGVYEAAIVYSDAMEAANRATLFKSSVKEIAHQHGMIATFMAKWTEKLPGCSGHVHQSLWDKKGKKNLFYDAEGELHMSDLMRHYLAGQLYCLPHILPMFAPTVNSYKRLVEGAWAPTTLTWGIDNRTVALRALPGSAKATRLETRVVGSDTNPYLAIAGCLAAGLYGVKHQLALETPRTLANGYEDTQYGILPRNLNEATEAMQQSEVAKELFGEEFVRHFTQTRNWEWRAYAKVVTDWELKRYFEII